ncbi:MAG: hypothetical protein HYY40_08150 [Bacteroidetes bacterium]|nr:hypothetical protein [Bacteroidota bacterium]
MITELKKRRICQMRKKGKGYKLIAQQLRISRDQVRDYLRTKQARKDVKRFRMKKVKMAKVYVKD